MTKRYIIYIYNNEYSGYYTGQNLVSPEGSVYPGIVAIMSSQSIKLYTSLQTCKSDIQKRLLSVCPDICRFDVIEKFSNTPVYRVNYRNHNIESEQKF